MAMPVETKESDICVCGHRKLDHHSLAITACEQCRCENFVPSALTFHVPKGETRTTSATGGEKGVKPERFDLIPVEALQEVARVYGFGAQKYAAHNWRKGYEWSKSYAAMMRHANAYWAGEDIDPETGCHHLASVIFHAMTLIVFADEQPQYDDRFKPELTQIQKNNLKAFTNEMLDHNRIAVKNYADEGSPLDDERSFVENFGAEAIQRFEAIAERVHKFGNPPRSTD